MAHNIPSNNADNDIHLIDDNNETLNDGAPPGLLLSTHEEARDTLQRLLFHAHHCRSSYREKLRPIREFTDLVDYEMTVEEAEHMYYSTGKNKTRSMKYLQDFIFKHTVIAKEINEVIQYMSLLRNVQVCIAGGDTSSSYHQMFLWLDSKTTKLRERVELITTGTGLCFEFLDELERLG